MPLLCQLEIDIMSLQLVKYIENKTNIRLAFLLLLFLLY